MGPPRYNALSRLGLVLDSPAELYGAPLVRCGRSSNRSGIRDALDRFKEASLNPCVKFILSFVANVGDRLVTELRGLGGCFELVGVGGKGFSKYMLIIDSMHGVPGVDGLDGQGFSIPSSGDDDGGSRRSCGLAELARDDMSAVCRDLILHLGNRNKMHDDWRRGLFRNLRTTIKQADKGKSDSHEVMPCGAHCQGVQICQMGQRTHADVPPSSLFAEPRAAQLPKNHCASTDSLFYARLCPVEGYVRGHLFSAGLERGLIARNLKPCLLTPRVGGYHYPILQFAKHVVRLARLPCLLVHGAQKYYSSVFALGPLFLAISLSVVLISALHFVSTGKPSHALVANRQARSCHNWIIGWMVSYLSPQRVVRLEIFSNLCLHMGRDLASYCRSLRI